MHGEASPHENITVITATVLRRVDSICQLKKVVDALGWVTSGDKRKDKRKENQKAKSVFMTKAIRASYTFSSRS